MSENDLKIGQINYLNLLPLFYLLKRNFPHPTGVSWVEGHPSEMNAALDAGKIDLSRPRPLNIFKARKNTICFRI